MGNPNLTEVTGGQNVRFVGRQAFYLCKRMKNLPDFVKNHRKCIYSQAAFKNAEALTNIKLSPNVQYTNALFKGCTSLKSAYIQGKGFLPNAKTWKYMNKNKINEKCSVVVVLCTENCRSCIMVYKIKRSNVCRL